MDMGGNVSEFCITAGTTNGRAFTAVNGDGYLDASGNANVSTWLITTATSFIDKGGDFLNDVTYVQVSNRKIRTGAALGIRLARTAE